MTKKLNLLLVAFAAVAFVVPTEADAAEATCASGTRCPVGTEITSTGKDITMTSSTLGPITCATLNLNARITKNNGTEVEASGSTTGPTQTGCNNGANRPVTVTSVNLTKIFAHEKAEAGKTKLGTVSFTATVDLPAGVVCTFTATNAGGIYVSGTDVIKSTGGGGINSTGGCGTARLDGEHTLEKTNGGTAVILD